MMKNRVILAEDEPSLGQIVKESLEANNFEVSWLTDGESVLKKLEDTTADIVVLDVMMPKLDGYTVAQSIRKKSPDLPIIFLTAKSETEDVVQGFEVGGNDYLKKPFSMQELVVRMKALLNRNLTPEQSIVKIGMYTFSPVSQTLMFNNQELSLTHRESQLLHALYLNRNRILDRSYILKKLWGDDDFFNGRSMDVFISKLRKKLAQDGSVSILNVRGYGYKLVCP